MLVLLKWNGVEMFFFPGRLFPCPVKLIGEPKVSDRKNAHLGRTLSAYLPLLWAMYTNKKILSRLTRTVGKSGWIKLKGWCKYFTFRQYFIATFTIFF